MIYKKGDILEKDKRVAVVMEVFDDTIAIAFDSMDIDMESEIKMIAKVDADGFYKYTGRKISIGSLTAKGYMWHPAIKQMIYNLSSKGNISEQQWSANSKQVQRLSMGLVFASREQAEQARNLINKLMTSFHKNEQK